MAMRKHVFIILLPLVLLVLGNVCGYAAEKTALLDGLMEPDKIEIRKGRMFISQEASILVYSLKDFSFIKKFGKRGEGPGEFTIDDTLGELFIDSNQKGLLVNSVGKILWFNLDGVFQKELRLKGGILGAYHIVGDGYAAVNFSQQDKKIYQAISLFDSKLNKLKEFYRQEYHIQGQNKIPVMGRPLLILTSGKRIVADTGKDEVIIFDHSGKQLASLKPETEEIPFTSAHKKKILEYYEKDPHARQFYERIRHRLDFPSQLPNVRHLSVTDDHIYIQTCQRAKDDKGKAGFLVYDNDGKLLKKTFYPVKDDLLNLPPKYTIEDGKIYELVEDLEEEEWYIYINDLK